MHHLGTAFQAVGRLVFWRTCEIMKSRRTIPMSGDVQPRHVFGDLLDRVDMTTCGDLDSAHNTAGGKHLKNLAARGEDPEVASCRVGEAMMEKIHGALSKTTFDMNVDV